MLPPSRRLFLPLSVCLSVCQDNSKSCWRILMKFLWRSGMVTMATTLYFGGGWTGWGQTGWGHGYRNVLPLRFRDNAELQAEWCWLRCETEVSACLHSVTIIITAFVNWVKNSAEQYWKRRNLRCASSYSRTRTLSRAMCDSFTQRKQLCPTTHAVRLTVNRNIVYNRHYNVHSTNHWTRLSTGWVDWLVGVANWQDQYTSHHHHQH